MKPIHLSMTAFTSYRGRAEVDFTALNQGLYLITGPTGAGKTTIFDAIVFALYGEASGSVRDPKMLHSDYAPRSTDTVVELLFEQDGRRFRVRRTIHFKKKRGVENVWDDTPDFDAELTGEGMNAIRKPTAVTARIRDLIGLDAGQFRKIVMLAQGEFSAFLRAESKDRAAILGNLFDDSLYKDCADLFKRASAVLEAERAAERRRIEFAVTGSGFPLPEDVDEEERVRFLPDHPQLAESIDALIAREQEELGKRQAVLTQFEQEQQALTRQEEKERQLKEQFDRRDRFAGRLRELEGQEAQMRELSGQLERLQRAVQTQPAKELLRSSRQELALSKKRSEEAARTLNGHEKAMETIRGNAGRAREAEPKVAEFHAAGERIRDSLTRYRQRDQARKELAAAEKQSAEMQEALTALKKGMEERQRLQQSYEQALLELRDVDTRVFNLTHSLGETEKKLKLLRGGADSVESLLREAGKTDEELRRAYAQSLQAEQQAAAASEHHRALNRRFLDGQAGLLGESLRREMREKHSCVCPVCRSEFREGDAVNFAALERDTPDKETVERAARSMTEAQERYRQASNRVEKLRTDRDAVRGKAVLQAHAAGLRGEWEELADGEQVREAIAEQSAEKERLEAGKLAAAADQKRRDQMQASVQTLKSQAENDGRQAEDLNEKLSGSRQDAAAARATLESLAGLEYENEAAAKAAMEQNFENERKFRAGIDECLRKEQEGEKTLSGLKTACAEAEQAAQRAADAEARAARQYADALRDSGFADAADCDRALDVAGRDIPRWQRSAQERLNQYRADCQSAGEQLRGLEDAIRGQERPDPAILEGRLRDCEARIREARAGEKDLQNTLNLHRNAAQTVRAARETLAGTDAASERVRSLSELMNSARTAEGRSSFASYVMGYVFRDILRAANQHLDIMTQGKYELRHSSRGSARSNSDLNINVLDHLTGEERSVASLSGGEGFQVSMSLALGLSDVVQARSGGTRVEAMFIDEGFGSLGDNELSQAIQVLNGISGGTRQIGIISHIDKLEECIPSRIEVSRDENDPGHGSILRII